jgi:serine/threonine-protein kinase
MELATGVTLDNYLQERSHSGASPDLSFGLLAGKGIAEALAAAHERQIVHRDIKPGNVILTDKRQIKVMDFGIARSQRSTTMALTSMGGAIGTPAYMAPEQASTSRPVDHRADLYALGVLMYSMFTFKVPFWDENVGSMVLRKLTDDVPSMRTENPEVTRGLDAVVLKLLERDPGKRFQSAIQVLAALEYLERFPDRVPPGLEATALRYDEA